MVNRISEMIKEMDAIVAQGKISVDKKREAYIVEDSSKNTFEVFQSSDGWHCSCEPYRDKGICEHILAVKVASQGGEIQEISPPHRAGRPRERTERRTQRRRSSGASQRQRRDWRRRPNRRRHGQSSRR